MSAAPTRVPTIVILLHDGYYSCGTGAARSNRAFLNVVIGLLRPEIRLCLLPIRLVPASAEYNPTWHQQMRTLLQSTNAEVIPVDNGTDGYARFGDLTAFQHACTHAAAIIHQRILRKADPLLVIAFDCPFYGLAKRLAPGARTDLVTVARSTAALHCPDDTTRTTWERNGLHQAVAAGGRVAAISGHMREHLTAAYGIPQAAILDLRNGLTTDDWTHIPPPDSSLLPRSLLPGAAQTGFLLAMGRAVPYKGFDDLLDALALLKNRTPAPPHALIAAVTDQPTPSPYQRHLAQRITDEHLNATLLPRFDPQLPTLLTHPALASVIVPSRIEPFGRIPLASIFHGADWAA